MATQAVQSHSSPSKEREFRSPPRYASPTSWLHALRQTSNQSYFVTILWLPQVALHIQPKLRRHGQLSLAQSIAAQRRQISGHFGICWA